MGRQLLHLVSFVLILGLAGAAAGQDWDIQIPSTSTPPVIDGQVDGLWSIASVQYITVPIEGTVDSPEDCSGSWRVMWDSENIYVIVDVNDENLFNDSGNSYQDDSVEFYFDGGNSKGGSPLSDNDRQYTFGWTADEIQGTNQDTAGVEHAQVNTETGWRIEMKLPWSSLQDEAPAFGDLIGIDCFYNDDDNGADTRESQVATFADDSGDWQNPADWGTGILVKGSREKATGPIPADGEQGVLRDAILAWSSGEFAVTHDVYFGTALEDVNEATRAEPRGVLVSQSQSENTYDPAGLLEYGQTYYWRIDEVNGAPDNTVFKGEIWSFTAELFADPITDVIATSNVPCELDCGPEKTVDGSGLDENDGHSIDAADMWLAIPGGVEPFWIQYEFDRVYKLYEMLVWNYNIQFELILGFGLQDVTVEYSEDAAEWVALDPVQFARGTARSGYAANTTVAFGGVRAKYVRLTVNSGYGLMGQYGLSEVRFLAIPVQARKPQPADGAGDVDVDAAVSWLAGREAVSHDVYFGTDRDAVADGTVPVATVAAGSYAPGELDFGQMYYWKVDEVNEAEALSVWEGDLWSFMTRQFAVVDDFESYDDDAKRIYDTWLDGWVNETGSTVGYMEAPFAEQLVVNRGVQSMPLAYDNSEAPFYSEAELALGSQDWTAGAADTFRLYFRGHPVDFMERTDGSIVMGAGGTDIWGTADQFRFAYMRLDGDGSITVRVDSVAHSNEWAKAGVMIRESLSAGSTHASVVVTPASGVSFQRRVTAGSDSADTTEAGLAAPYWVRITRVGRTFTAERSADGVAWEPITATAADSTVDISMSGTIYIGLAVTSHDATIPTIAEFSNVATSGGVTGQWRVEAIGVEQPSNAPDSLYVAVEDSSGRVAVVMHPDPAATTATDWQEWAIPLAELSAAGVNLARVDVLYVGVGDRDNPQAGGLGTIYIDDIGFGRPAPEVAP